MTREQFRPPDHPNDHFLRDASDEALSHISDEVRVPAFREDSTVVDMSNHILAVAYPADESG